MKDLNIEEIENLTYDELALIILRESGKKMKLHDINKKIAKIKKLDDSEIENNLLMLFEILSTNKQFIQLEKGYWDIANNHKVNIIIEDDEEIDIIEKEETEEEIIDEEENIDEEDIDYYSEENEDDEDDDLSDLIIIEDEEEVSLN